jgi:photosystem II stability/assembly factor-like uncharacterized protein
MLLTNLRCAHAQWEIETSNTTADLRGIHSIGNGVAWASGTNGTVLRTEDSGYVWQTCAVPPGAEHLDFRGIQGFDANTAIVMSSGKGDLSRLYKTTDGCHTWKLIFTNPDADGFWDAIQFADHNFGVVFGDPVDQKFYARQTTDGGLHWRKFESDESLATGKMKAGAFAASNSTLLLTPNPNVFFAIANVGDQAKIYRSTFGESPEPSIGGKRPRPKGFNWWDPESIEIPSNGESSGVFSVAAEVTADWELRAIVAVGGDYRKPESEIGAASASEDSGSSWELAQTPPHGYRSSVAYDAATKTWITVGPNGTDISTDDGKNWRPLRPNPRLHEPPDADSNWNAISLPFVVGPHGRIAKLNPGALKP